MLPMMHSLLLTNIASPHAGRYGKIFVGRTVQRCQHVVTQSGITKTNGFFFSFLMRAGCGNDGMVYKQKKEIIIRYCYCYCCCFSRMPILDGVLLFLEPIELLVAEEQ